MKTYHVGCSLRPRLSVFAVVLAGLIPTALLAASSGELDPTFDPVAAEIPAAANVIVAGQNLFLHDASTGLMRLHENGRLDASWKLSAPAGLPLYNATPTPHGGWVVSGFGIGTSYWDHGDGSFQRAPASFLPFLPCFPQDDGTLIVPASGSAPDRYNPDGSADLSYSQPNRRLVSVPFSDGASISVTGGPSLRHSADASGRIIIGGNFTQFGDFERLGLARILPDGSPDPSWNPSPQLGVGQPGVSALNAIPEGFYVGPSNSVVAALLFKSTNGRPNFHIATINEDGSVHGSFAAPSFGQRSFIRVQPDGRLLVAGSFTNWNGQTVTGLIRLETDGSVDPGFNVQLTRINGVPRVEGMDLDRFGRLVISGYFDSVNGVPRPGLARVFAYDPEPRAPGMAISHQQPRIATNEVLYLTASVAGFPPPELQWYRNGVPIPGANSRGLRVAVENPENVGAFRLVATSTSGSTDLDFSSVDLAVRSPKPGSTNSLVYWPNIDLPPVRHLVPLSDGRVLVGCGVRSTLYTNDVRIDLFTNSAPMVARFLKDGSLDPQFGNGGTISGNGYVDSLRVLSNGHILIAGGFTELAGSTASGLAELDASGALVPRAFPTLEPILASNILPLPAGGYVVSGLFTNVGGASAFRMVKLTETLAVDPSFQSPLAAWQFVDTMELDPQGKVLIGGERIYTDVALTNAPVAGLKRLLSDGSPDPAFTAYSGKVRSIFVEPSETILVGPPFSRLATDGAVLKQFELSRSGHSIRLAFDPDHTVVRLGEGGGATYDYPNHPSSPSLVRWTAEGKLDLLFSAEFDHTSIDAVAALSDGSLLLAISSILPAGQQPWRRLALVPPDSDMRLTAPRLANGQMVVDLATQPGRRYEIRRQTDIGSGDSTLIGEVIGDGYIQQVSTAADSGALFIVLRRQ